MRRFDNLVRLAGPAALALLVVEVPRVSAQDRQSIEDASAQSAIVTRTIAQLSFAGLVAAPDVRARVFRLPDGGWGVSSAQAVPPIQRFDAAGAHTGTFDPSVQASGPSGDIFAATLRGELWLVDARNERLSTYSKELRLTAERRLDVHAAFVSPTLEGTSLLVSGSAYAGSTYYSLARVAREPRGDAFGLPLGGQPLPSSQWLIRPRMAVETRGGEIWAIAISGGAIDIVRSRDLSVVRRMKLPGSDMAREAQWILRDLATPPAPRLLGVTADTTGVLWLCFGVADRAWKPGIDPRKNVEKYFDTRVLAIDPVKHAIVGRIQLDAICMSVERNLISCADTDDRMIRIVALTIERSSGSRAN